MAGLPTGEGVIPTAIPLVSIFQSTTNSRVDHVLYRPVLCLVAQGAKRVRLGGASFEIDEDESLVVGIDIPLEATILRGSPERPFRAVNLEFDAALLQEVAVLMPHPPVADDRSNPGVFLQEIDAALTDAFVRLVRLARDPNAASVLGPAVQREIVFRLLSGPQGGRFARLTFPTGHTHRIAGAMREIRQNLSTPVRIPELAARVGMSESSFHQRFKELAACTPLQFQKNLRLLEARRRMLSDGMAAAEAAYQVGYRSASQFNREYVRYFGAPPHRDIAHNRLDRARSSPMRSTIPPP